MLPMRQNKHKRPVSNTGQQKIPKYGHKYCCTFYLPILFMILKVIMTLTANSYANEHVKPC